MSKIVVLSFELTAPQILGDVLDRLKTNRPDLAEWIQDLDIMPLIEDCIQNSLNSLCDQVDGIELSNEVLDYYGNASSSQEIIGAMKTDKLPNGMGIFMSPNGSISFLADDYTSGWVQEINRLQKLFKKFFILEANKMILDIIGYEVKIESTTISNKETGEQSLAFHLVGVRT